MYRQLSLFVLSETGAEVDYSESIYHHQIYKVKSHGLLYYRYVCNCGHNLLIQATIPGGNCSRKLSQSRAALVGSWIDQDLEPAEIQRRIRRWAK